MRGRFSVNKMENGAGAVKKGKNDKIDLTGIYTLFMNLSQLWRDLGCKAGSRMIGLPDALFMRRLSPLC
jgi:hypothetical protein